MAFDEDRGDNLYPHISRRLRELAGTPFVRAHAQVEISDERCSAMLFINRGDGAYHCLAAPDPALCELFAHLRERCRSAGLGAWSQATFSLEAGGTFGIELGHGDISNLGQAPARRDAWIRRVLGAGTRVVGLPG